MSAPEPENTNNRNTRKGGRAYNFNNNKRLYMKEIFCCFLGTIGIGCLVYLGASIGYGMPYATQFSNPQKVVYEGGYQQSFGTLPQAEPNGLYMPPDAHGTWIMLYNAETKQADPVYVEPDVIVSPFRLTAQECVNK